MLQLKRYFLQRLNQLKRAFDIGFFYKVAHSPWLVKSISALVLYGPVLATSGAFGLAILEVESEAEARSFGEGDPSVRAGLNRFEICPMRVSAARAK